MHIQSAFFFFSSRRRHTRWPRDWSSDVCSSDLINREPVFADRIRRQLDLPQELVEARMLLVTSLLFHGLADHLRIRDHGEVPASLTSRSLFVSNLVDSLCALLQTPPLPDTLSLFCPLRRLLRIFG